MRTLLLIISLVFAGFPLFSQPGEASYNEDIVEVYEDLFSGEEPLHLTLKFDVNALQKTPQPDVYHDAEMTLVGNDASQASHPVQIMARESIRQKICYLSPLWVKIGDSGIHSDTDQDLFRMNLVMPCKNSAQYESYLLREYLAYKLYNILTPLSYQVRLVRLSIVDTGKGNEVTEDWAFIQEPDELMALRLNGTMITSDKLSMSGLNPEVMNSMAMFQFMIGNADYAVTGRYKLNVLELDSGNPAGILPVPYDFDYSGLVNADYAIPGQNLGINSVRDRYYLGPCRTEQVYKETIQELSKSRDKLIAYIKDFRYLGDEDKADMIGYLDSYFNESAESGFIAQKITPTCR